MERRVGLSVILAASSLAAACELGEQAHVVDDGDYSPYRVYEAYLREQGGDAFVVASPTTSFGIDGPTTFEFDVHPSAIDSYHRRRETKSLVEEDEFQLSVPVWVTTREEVYELTRPDPDGECDWDLFKEAYPGARSYETFTNVGFSDDGTEAVICAANSGECGWGYGGCAHLSRPSADSTDWSLVKYVGMYDA